MQKWEFYALLLQCGYFTLCGGTMLARCFARLAERIIPGQTGADSSFTDELTRTKSFSYCMYNLEGCAVTAQLAHHRGVDLWNAVCAGGKGIARSLDFILPFYENPTLWQHQQIEYDGGNPSAAFQRGVSAGGAFLIKVN